MGKLLQVPIFICYSVSTVAFVVVGFMMFFLLHLHRWKGEKEPTYGTCYSGVLPFWLESPRRRALCVRLSRYATAPHFFVLHGEAYSEMLEFKSPTPRHDWLAWKHILFGFKGDRKKKKLRT